MLHNDGGYVARRPRHEAAGSAGFRLEVERAAGREPSPVEGQLLDLSRNGIRLRVAAPLELNETITIRLWDEKSGFEMTHSGRVRRQTPEEGGTWSVGCELTPHVEWQTLGEMFFNEILSTDRAEPSV